ncbi:MAG: chemotaxis protein CheW [Acidobacteriota bacterium]|nr:chemotaxis protein CheW [Acidobacteriota bacterium]
MLQAVVRAGSDAQESSVCTVGLGELWLGIETACVREVLGERDVETVPLMPSYLAGVLPNRGVMLTVLCLRSLLGMPRYEGRSSVMIVEDGSAGGPFGLLVDRIGGIVSVTDAMLEPTPSTLKEQSRQLFNGVYKLQDRLLVRIEAKQLRPESLSELQGLVAQ